MRCFFLVLRHTPGTPGTGLTSLLLTGGGCRMGLGARVRHTGSPAAHSRIPVIPGGVAGAVRGGAASGSPPTLHSHPPVIGWVGCSMGPTSHPHPRLKPSGMPYAGPPWCLAQWSGAFPLRPVHQLVKGWSQGGPVGPALLFCPELDLTCQGRVDWPGTIQVLHRERGDPEGRREEAAAGFPHNQGSGDTGWPSGSDSWA